MRVRSPWPEKTLMMITFCPSSRRWAISPPHESAASSGCGETKMWLISKGSREQEGHLRRARHARYGLGETLGDSDALGAGVAESIFGNVFRKPSRPKRSG